MTPWSWHGQWLRQRSSGSVLFELVHCSTLPGIGPGNIKHCWTKHGVPWQIHNACPTLDMMHARVAGDCATRSLFYFLLACVCSTCQANDRG